MSVKIKAGTRFSLPFEIEDDKFSTISSIEFIFKQKEKGETIKTALWSRDGKSRDAELVPNTQTINVIFNVEDSYLFKQEEMFFCDTRIHYDWTENNPYTPVLQLRMSKTLFAEGEEVQ